MATGDPKGRAIPTGSLTQFRDLRELASKIQQAYLSLHVDPFAINFLILGFFLGA
jgi:hypothetical protein